MTRRKRTPEPQTSQKRTSFYIPASLQHLSTLSRNLAQEADIRTTVDKENENSRLVAKAQALSASPPPPSEKQEARPVRFRSGHQKEFPQEQTWVRSEPSSSAAGHARFLQKRWEEAQISEQARQAILPYRRYETDNATARPRTESEARVAQQTQVHGDLPTADLRSAATVQPTFPAEQQWPHSEDGDIMRNFNEETEKRRQAIIEKLKERNAASIAPASTNVQASGTRSNPLSSSKTKAKEGQSTSTTKQPRERNDVGPERAPDPSPQSSKIAALIAQKRAENAANGRLNSWLHARDRHNHLQTAASYGVPGIAQGPLGPPLSFPTLKHPPKHRTAVRPRSQPVNSQSESVSPSHPHKPTSIQQQKLDENADLEGEEEIDLRSLFSSPTPNPSGGSFHDNSRGKKQRGMIDRGESSGKDQAPTQLLSPAVSPASQSNGQRGNSPSTQLLNEMAVSSDAGMSFPMARNSNSDHETQWSSDAQYGTQYSQITPQKPQSRMHRQVSSTDRVTQQPRAQSQTMMVDNIEEMDVHTLAQQPSQYEAAQQLLDQLRREDEAKSWNNTQAEAGQWDVSQLPATTSSMTTPGSYYRIKQHLWNSYGTDQFAVNPPGYVRNNSSSLAGSGMTAGFATNNTGVYQPSRGAGYSSFAHGGGVNANFRSASQNGFQVPKR